MNFQIPKELLTNSEFYHIKAKFNKENGPETKIALFEVDQEAETHLADFEGVGYAASDFTGYFFNGVEEGYLRMNGVEDKTVRVCRETVGSRASQNIDFELIRTFFVTLKVWAMETDVLTTVARETAFPSQKV
jgi:hypothetical protein